MSDFVEIGVKDLAQMQINYERLEQRVAELEAERDDLIVLLSKWYLGWNDGCEPDGDLLDDTLNALETLK
jgi:hypothetical protein